MRKSLLLFAEKPQIKINSLKKQKHGYLMHTWSDKAYKGTIVNQALSYFHGGSLEITLSVLKALKISVKDPIKL